MIHNQKVTAIVPIKGHSERVKGKNFRNFNNKPLYHHIIETLENTYAVDQILVDTDSDIVVNEAPTIASKVKIIKRPENLIGDFVSVNKLIEYDLSLYDSEIYLQTHATNPLLKSETIAKALKDFVENEEGFDSLFTVNQYQSRFYSSDGKPINHNPDELLRTQDLPPVYEENSCIYIFDKIAFGKQKRRIGMKPMLYPIPTIEAIDIDDEFTFKLAEILSLYSHEHIQ